MNACHFLGNLVHDPEIKAVGDSQVVNFRIAINHPPRNGEKETSFLRCEAWGKTAELIEKYFKKGDPIILHASVRVQKYKDKDTGKDREAHIYRVDRFDFVPGNRKAKEQSEAAAPPKARSGATREEEDDIPF